MFCLLVETLLGVPFPPIPSFAKGFFCSRHKQLEVASWARGSHWPSVSSGGVSPSVGFSVVWVQRHPSLGQRAIIMHLNQLLGAKTCIWKGMGVTPLCSENLNPG